MNNQFLQTRFANLLLYCAVCGVFLAAFASATAAQTVTFAQFLERSGSQDFVFTNNSTDAVFDTVSGGATIYFLYQNTNGLDSSLQGFQNAHLFVSTPATRTPATLNMNNLNQPLDQSTVIRIVRDTPTAVGVGSGSRTNLLTATISANTGTPAITGTNTGNSGTFSVTTPDHVVTFTSDFVSFAQTTERNLAVSFSSVTPSLAIGTGNFLNSFTAAGSGTFAANPPPVVVGPTAAAVSVSGRVLAPSGRGLSGARVSLTDARGITQTAATNAFGYYRLSNVAAGQVAVISVISKRYAFTPRVTMVTDNLNDWDFTAGQ